MNEIRRNKAKEIRIGAAVAASMRFHPEHKTNGDEQKFTYSNGDPTCVASFTKGLPHNHTTGLVINPADYQQFIKGIDSSDPEDFIATPLGPIGYQSTGSPIDTWKTIAADTKNKLRGWESQAAGNLFDLEGPDAQSLTMPPCPKLGSAELTAEMGEVYVQTLLRDVPFTAIVAGDDVDITDTDHNLKSIQVSDILSELKQLAWFNSNKNDGQKIYPKKRDSRPRRAHLTRTHLNTQAQHPGIPNRVGIGEI